MGSPTALNESEIIFRYPEQLNSADRDFIVGKTTIKVPAMPTVE